MNKITHGILLIFILFQMFCSTRVDAQYLNSNTNEMPLGIMSNQYWQGRLSNNDRKKINISEPVKIVLSKSGLSILFGAGGAFLGGGVGHIILARKSLVGAAIGAPIGILLFSSWGVKLISDNYDQDVSYGRILAGGLGGAAIGVTIGYGIEELTEKNMYNAPLLIGGLFACLIAEVWISEIDFSNSDQPEESIDHSSNKTHNLTFHEYVKSTQVFNFEVLRIDF